MAHHNDDSNMSKEQLEFNDLIRRGDDFIKIQIYRNARECYTFALESNINNELANTKLSECNALIKPESSTIKGCCCNGSCCLYFISYLKETIS